MGTEVMDDVCDFNALYKAMTKCRRGVMWKDSVARYSNNGLASVLRLKDSLNNGSYKISDYYEFVIHEPKRRDIVSTRFKDRIFQRSLCDNYLYNAITKSFIYDNGACLVGKGTDFARNRFKTHLIKYVREYGPNGYILHCDLKNYFGSTLHKTAIDAMEKRIGDKWALSHVEALIRSYDKGNARGLGLGSQITQLIQLAVLDDLDHKAKERWLLKFYDRYMDDINIIYHCKDRLHNIRDKIEKELSMIDLSLNLKKTQIVTLKDGIVFLGFRYQVTQTGRILMTLPKSNISKRKRKIRKHLGLVAKGRMTLEKARECYMSWRAHAVKGDTYNCVMRMDEYFNKKVKEIVYGF